MIKKIGILILIVILGMCTVIPMALADDNYNQNINDEIIVKDEKGNIFKIIWNKITSILSFSENGKETTIDVEEEHPSGKVNHGTIVSIIAKITNELESVVGKTHGLIMRAIAKTNWGKQIEDRDSLEDKIEIKDKEEKEKPEKSKKPDRSIKPDVIPPKKGFEEHPKKSRGVLETVFDKIINTLFVKQNEVLKRVKQKVPDEAKEAVQRAIENNARKMERMEGTKTHVQERVKNRNQNNK